MLSRCVAVVMLCGLFGGCTSPLRDTRTPTEWQSTIERSVDREIQDAPREYDRSLESTTTAVETELATRRDLLDQLTPALGAERIDVELGPDLFGDPEGRVEVLLDDLVITAVGSNLEVDIARIRPAIVEQDVIAAEATFDAVLFGSVDWTKTDQPTPVPVVGVVPVGTPFNANERLLFEGGLTRRFDPGTEVTVSTDLTRFDDQTPGFSRVPDPSYASAVRIGVTQPLMRGFGSDVNRAEIHFALNERDRSEEELRLTLHRLTQEVEDAYWDLAFAWVELEIRQWLIDVGERVRDVLDRRREHDTVTAQYADAVATVERRRSNVIVTRRNVRTASDRLKLLINDPQLPIGQEVVLKPASSLLEEPIRVDLRESIFTAMRERPEIRQALLAIEDTQIRQVLAENAELPLLNISAQAAYLGLDDNAGDAYGDIGSFDFVDYIVGLVFEQPWGHRAGSAEVLKSRLARSSSLLAYQQTVRGIILDVKTALREVITNFELIQARRSTRIAEAENLRALRVEEETMRGLTPEFLNLKFQRQDALALARAEEVAAIVNYEKSLAALHRAMGTGLAMRGIKIDVAQPPYDELIIDGPAR